ncbi:PREDICTED: sorting nexin-3 isoform X1 [Dinoponera quadriceps]|uniref:Sorting nexin-3 n=1 Tax=Dinoponera quadriceps TaxID=609295 RepID=A0A6P3XX88_DINQU|nr:PREDICTED: sorting nexin-3 isoform X1 [Dinoponera quadriceps]
MADTTVDATRRLNVKKQTLDDAYAAPANFLEIDVINPITHGVGKKRYTDYEVRMRTNLPVFKVKDSTVRRRYSDFEWLRNELERDSKIVVPPLPGKAWKRQMPFRGDDGIFEEDFIEDRRKGLEVFVNNPFSAMNPSYICVPMLTCITSSLAAYRVRSKVFLVLKRLKERPFTTPDNRTNRHRSSLKHVRTSLGTERTMFTHVSTGGCNRQELCTWKNT